MLMKFRHQRIRTFFITLISNKLPLDEVFKGVWSIPNCQRGFMPRNSLIKGYTLSKSVSKLF
jgi:hypothetical protein